MIAFAHRRTHIDTTAAAAALAARLDELRAAPSHEGLTDLFVDFARPLAAVEDALAGSSDQRLTAWRAAAGTLASALAASWSQDRDDTGRLLRDASAALDGLRRHGCGRLEAGALEGFDYYALFPEQYLLAARSFAASEHPRRVLAVGIRSIGASLAHVVAAGLRREGVEAAVVSVRPSGPAFDRLLVRHGELSSLLRSGEWPHVAVVDEGPGLSGTTIAAVVEAAASHVSASRIVIFPGWQPDASAFASARARRVWSAHRIYVASFEHLAACHPALAPIVAGVDLGGGRWREIVAARPVPAVHPQHERRKYLIAATSASPYLAKFAGLGSHGREAFALACDAASRGFGPGVDDLRAGFIGWRWQPPRPSRAGPSLNRIAGYLAFIASRKTPARAAPDALAPMLLANAEAACPRAMRQIDALCETSRSFDEPAVKVDGRLLRHEWVGDLKTDHVDHHADEFFPGATDIAWDVAGACVEHCRTRQARARLTDLFRRTAGDDTVARRLPFYEAAYLAFRIGYCALAAGSVADERDRVRFVSLRARYARLLAALAARHDRTARR